MTEKISFLSREGAIGTFLNTGSDVSAECIGNAGLDYFIIDTEHGCFGLTETAQCIKSAEGTGIVPFVRVPEISREKILKSLDAGARGIIIPGVRTIEEVRKIVSYGKYTPMGERGFCPTRCCSYGYRGAMEQGIRPYLDECNKKTMLIPQCETTECLAAIDEIVQIEGVDAIFIGPFDLSVAMDIPGDFNNPVFLDAIFHVRDVCHQAGKPVIIFAPNIETAKLRLEQSFDSVTVNGDLNVLTEAYLAMMKALR